MQGADKNSDTEVKKGKDKKKSKKGSKNKKKNGCNTF